MYAPIVTGSTLRSDIDQRPLPPTGLLNDLVKGGIGCVVYRFGLLRIYAINCIPGQWPIGKDVRSWAASLPSAWEHLTFALLFPTMQEVSFFSFVACSPPPLPSHLRSTAIHLRHSPATTIAIVLLRRKTFLQLTVLRRCMQRIATKKPFANRLYLSIQSASAKLPCRGRIGFMSLSTRCSTQWCRPVAHIAQRPLQTLVDAPHCSVVHA